MPKTKHRVIISVEETKEFIYEKINEGIVCSTGEALSFLWGRGIACIDIREKPGITQLQKGYLITHETINQRLDDLLIKQKKLESYIKTINSVVKPNTKNV